MKMNSMIDDCKGDHNVKEKNADIIRGGEVDDYDNWEFWRGDDHGAKEGGGEDDDDDGDD